jgi:hypothetical protein
VVSVHHARLQLRDSVFEHNSARTSDRCRVPPIPTPLNGYFNLNPMGGAALFIASVDVRGFAPFVERSTFRNNSIVGYGYVVVVVVVAVVMLLLLLLFLC